MRTLRAVVEAKPRCEDRGRFIYEIANWVIGDPRITWLEFAETRVCGAGRNFPDII
jgi:hypothetical protein